MDNEAFAKGYFKLLADKPLFDEFFEKDFRAANGFCGFNQNTKIAVQTVKKWGCGWPWRQKLFCPQLPRKAESDRCVWNRRIAKRLEVQPEECLMVGNDVKEDMVAKETGMQVFLLTDCLINKERKDINQYSRGSFDQLLQFIA